LEAPKPDLVTGNLSDEFREITQGGKENCLEVEYRMRSMCRLRLESRFDTKDSAIHPEWLKNILGDIFLVVEVRYRLN
jgi:hypothetical protein